MVGFRFALLISVLVPALMAAAELPALPPGKTVPVPWDGLKRPLLVRVPDNYTPDRAWPVVFHFHGTGGEPTLDIPQAYTSGRDFILVGMEYVTRDLPATTPDYLEKEWASLLAVRDGLAAQVRIDLQRTYVGGFSMGGWFASEFMEVHGRELAGAYVLGAGKRPRNKRETKDFGLTKPVYLGAGQLDLNYIYSVQGIKHFGSLGGIVTFEDFLGSGHRMPMGGKSDPLAPALVHWFRIEALRHQPDALRSEAAAWCQNTLAAANRDRDPLTRWLRLSRARRHPFLPWLTPANQQSLATHLTTLEKSEEFKIENRTRSSYFSLVDRELQGPADGDLWAFSHQQAGKYHDLWKSAPATYHGRRAAIEFARLREQVAQVDRWRFPDDTTKSRALQQAADHPLPPSPPSSLVQEFQSLRLSLQPD